MADDTTPLELTAHIVGNTRGWILEPASARRRWMDDTEGFAYRCLPLAMANQAGWVVRAPTEFSAVWNGGIASKDTTVTVPANAEGYEKHFLSHFGWGIVTVSLPWLFRTAPGYGLMVRGPTNYFKAGIAALDGLVETDWASSTFTMNWKLTDPDRVVRFSAGEPVCMITPFRLDTPERFVTAQAPIEANPELHAAFKAWAASRSAFNADPGRTATDWQKDYLKGEQPGTGEKAKAHRTRFTLKRFE
jgi:hypothetical protein